MAKIEIGGRLITEGTDDQMKALQVTISEAMRAGGGWITINNPPSESIVSWVGPGIPVSITYDTDQVGAVRIG